MNANMMRKAAQTGTSGLRRYSTEVVRAFRSAARPPVRYRTDDSVIAQLGRLDRAHLGAMWIGHATMLLRVGGLNILTDPVLGERIGVNIGPRQLGLTPRALRSVGLAGLGERSITFGLSRLVDPAIGIDDLPPIDLILLSHAHFDHLDRPSLAALAAGPARHATVITARKTAGLIPRARARRRAPGFARIIELEWNDAFEFEGRAAHDDHASPTLKLRIRAVRPRHWGARTAVDHHRACNAYAIESRGHRVLFGGDTAHTEAFKDVGPCDLAVLGIGAYEPWTEAHATPEEAWSMFQDVRSGFANGLLAPMHHSTFRLGDEPAGEPMQRLLAAAGHRDDRPAPVVCRSIGDLWTDDDRTNRHVAAIAANRLNGHHQTQIDAQIRSRPDLRHVLATA